MSHTPIGGHAQPRKPGKGARKSDARRNIAIAPITEAVEEASSERVAISRGSSDVSWYFKGAAGGYVRDVMALLGWSNERVLVCAFDKLRRRVKQSASG